MPFNIFPALQTRVPSEPANALALQQLSTSRQGNALAQEKAGFVRQDRARATAGRGAAANLLAASPADRPTALAKAAKVLDVDQLIKFTEQFKTSDQANQDKIKADLKKSAGIAVAWQSKTPEEKAAILPQVVAHLNEMGLKDVPTTLAEFDLYTQVMALNNSNVQAAAAKAQFEKPDTVSPEREDQLIRIAQGSKGPTTGIRLTTTPDGGVNFATGVSDGVPQDEIGKTTQGKLEEKQLNANEQMARIAEIEDSFDPTFLEIGTRLSSLWSATKEKAGIKISDVDKAGLRKISIFKRRTISNINALLNELSGAAVSPQEAIRLRESLPDAGDGIFDGDSPTVFKAKMDDITRSLRLAAMRYSYARHNGLDPQTYAKANRIGDTLDLIDLEGTRLEVEVRTARPDLPQEAIEIEVKSRLSTIFGVQF